MDLNINVSQLLLLLLLSVQFPVQLCTTQLWKTSSVEIPKITKLKLHPTAITSQVVSLKMNDYDDDQMQLCPQAVRMGAQLTTLTPKSMILAQIKVHY